MDKNKMNCPRCGAELVRENCICPSCEWSIHRVEHPANKYIRYVQSPVSNTVVTLAFLLALAGQLMIVFTGDFFALPFANNLMVAAHVVKTIGETALLFCLMYGLKFEFWRFRFHLALVILMLLAYHLMSAALLTVLDRGMDPNEMTSWFTICGWMLIVTEVIYALLGVRLYDTYNGNLSFIGIMMLIAALLHLGFNVFLNMTGHVLLCDIAIFAANAIYFYCLKAALLDHKSYLLFAKQESKVE